MMRFCEPNPENIIIIFSCTCACVRYEGHRALILGPADLPSKSPPSCCERVATSTAILDRFILNQVWTAFYCWIVKRLVRFRPAFATRLATQADNQRKRSLIYRHNGRVIAHAIDAFARACIIAAICCGAQGHLGQIRRSMPDARERAAMTRLDALIDATPKSSRTPPETARIRPIAR